MPLHAAAPPHLPTPSRRRGLGAVELLVGLPILLILLLAIVEFALIMNKLQQVALASRTGAGMAAQQSSSSFNVAAIKTEVDRQLCTAGINSGSCEVLLQHNVGSSAPVVIPSGAVGACPCTSPATPALPTSAVVPDGCVRVSVCVRLSALAPDLLSSFGLSIQGLQVLQTTTLAYEGSGS
jgi:TadE-like protein